MSDYIETGSDGAPLERMDVLADPCDLLEQVFARDQVDQLRKAIAQSLNPCEQQVIVLRYGLDGNPPKRQREVAQITGLSRSYISRIEKRSLEKLRTALEK